MSKHNKKSKKKSKKYKGHRVTKAILLILIILLIIVAGIIAGGWNYVDEILGKITHETIDTSQIGIDSISEKNLKGYRNIALLGIDSRENDYGSGNRSDTIVIASINEKTNDVKLISVYRDTYLQVKEKGKNTLDKITHAYAYGGPQNALLALNTNLDLNIKEYVAVNFQAVATAVDQLGGITLNIKQSEINYINEYIAETARVAGKKAKYITKAGEQTVDGVQAVTYARIRKDAGDYRRAERTRAVIEAIVAKAKTQNLTQLKNLANTILPYVKTNISTTDIISLIPTAIKVNFTEGIGWPYDNKGKTIDAWYGVPCTLESNVERLHKEIFANEEYVVPDEIKEISSKIETKTGYHVGDGE